MFHKKAKYKILSFSTTMRNPYRIANFLKTLLPFENRILTHEIIMQIIASLIKNKLYMPTYATRNFKNIVENDLEFNENQILEIIANSPQKHKEAGFNKGWDSRFDTFYKLPMEFGFCLYVMNEPLIISNTGHLLIDAINEIPSNEEKIENIFLNCMMKYQCNNPFRSILNSNVPLLLLLHTMNALKQRLIGDSKIHKSEIAFFLCWKDSDYSKLADFIISFRKQYQSFNYSNEVIYEKCLEILESNNTKRFKKSQICGEAIDEYIRKMRITGIISLRGNGRFLDFNTFEISKIEYILTNYSASGPTFSNKSEYFNFMGYIDSNILRLKTQFLQDTESLKQKTLDSFANRYNKRDIYKELAFLTSKKSSSKDEVLKFIPEPTRFEFLISIALKQHFVNLEILPNYSIDDEGLPKCHASGNKPDIVCRDVNNNKSIVEVSLLCGRAQLTNELIPITRHLKKFINSNQITVFAVFIAPTIHEDSKLYVEFIKFKDNLDIRNFNILEFIKNLQKASQENLSINQALLQMQEN